MADGIIKLCENNKKDNKGTISEKRIKASKLDTLVDNINETKNLVTI